MASETETETGTKERKVDHDENDEKEVQLKTAPTPTTATGGLLLALNFVALLLCMFAACLDLTIISTAIPRITTQFHSLNDVGWYSSAFFLTIAIFQAIWGKIYKYFHLKWSFLAALLIFEVANIGAAVSVNSAGFIAGRAIAGIGGGGLINGTYIIVAHIVPPARIPVFYGLTGIVFVLASVCGPLIGGAFTSDVTWRWCFWINLPIGGFAALVLCLCLRLPENSKPAKATKKEILLQFDIPGALSLLGSCICFLLVMENGGINRPWSDSYCIGLLIGWILLLMAFVAIELWQGDRALINPKHLAHRGILVCCLFVFFLGGANYLRIYYLPIYFQSIAGSSPQRSGIYLLGLMLPTSTFTILAGATLEKVGYYQPFLVIGTVIVTIGSGLTYTLGLDFSLAKSIGYQVLIGVGDGSAAQIPVTAVQAMIAREDIAVVTSTVLFFQLACGVIATPAGQSLFANLLLQSLPQYAPGVDDAQVLQAGAYDLQSAVLPSQLEGVRRAYLHGIRGVWIMTIAFSGMALVIGLFAPRISIKKNKAAQAGSTGDEGGGKGGGDEPKAEEEEEGPDE